MNGWSIVAAVAVVLFLGFRLWLRWFSRRPLSRVDDYAMAVDTELDTPPDTMAEDEPPAGATPVVGSTTAPTATQSAEPPPVPSGRVIPRQRTAADVRAAIPPVRQPGC